MSHHGVIIRIDPGKRFGLLCTTESRLLPFRFAEYQGQAGSIVPPLPALFDAAPHPHQAGRTVAVRVRSLPLRGMVPTPGVISGLFARYGFLDLLDGRQGFFSLDCVTVESPQVGASVRGVLVPGRDNRLFALTLELADPATAVPPVPRGRIGAASFKGRRGTKSVNDDAFLIHPLAGGKMWLLAVADGVSNPANGWWASDKCMELLWRSLPTYEPQLLGLPEQRQDTMQRWMEDVREKFLHERSNALREFQSASSTLTFAVVHDGQVLYANSGDTPLYRFDRADNRLHALIRNVLSRSRGDGAGLVQHIGAPAREWRARFGEEPLPEGSVVVLCSDGVAPGGNELPKQPRIEKGLADPRRPLQECVTEILTQIAELGETDDLTLIAFRP
jgi:serine/threonine protein phosphatase PrpC